MTGAPGFAVLPERKPTSGIFKGDRLYFGNNALVAAIKVQKTSFCIATKEGGATPEGKWLVCHGVTPHRVPSGKIVSSGSIRAGEPPRLSIKGVRSSSTPSPNAYPSLSKLSTYSWCNSFPPFRANVMGWLRLLLYSTKLRKIIKGAL